MKTKLQKLTTQQPLFEAKNPFAEQEQDLPQDLLRVYYTYFDGFLIKKIGKKNTPPKTLKNNRYRKLKFDGRYYRLGRQIYIYHYGTIPKGMFIDHIDGNRHNNHIENLRLAHPDQNQWNRKINDSHRSTDHKGVQLRYIPTNKSPWFVEFRLKSNYALRFRRQRRFKTKTEAEAFIRAEVAVFEATRALVHREYTNHG
jgi:hypothetical protein